MFAQFTEAESISKSLIIDNFTSSLDSNSEYEYVKHQIYLLDPQYMDDMDIYNLAIYTLDKHADSLLYLHLLNLMSPNAFSGCVDPLPKPSTYCYTEFLEEDFRSLDNYGSSLYLKSLDIFNKKIQAVQRTYSIEIQKLCDSLQIQDQLIRMDIVNRWSTIDKDSVVMLMKPQNAIDSSNKRVVDSLILASGFPGDDKITGGFLFLYLQHVQNQGIYMPFLEQMAKRKQLSWGDYRAIYFRYYTTPRRPLKQFPFIRYEPSNGIEVTKESMEFFFTKLDSYYHKKGYVVRLFVSNDTMKMELKKMITNDKCIINVIPTFPDDWSVNYTIDTQR